MASIIKYHNGTVIKNAGDCLFYYFPKTVNATINESDFQDVLDCGLEMVEAHSISNSNLHKNELSSINYRISGNYGRVELDTSTNSTNVDLFGPTVNICSKINHLALPNEKVIYKNLYDVLRKTSFFKDYCFKEIIEGESNKEYYVSPYPVYAVHKINNPR